MPSKGVERAGVIFSLAGLTLGMVAGCAPKPTPPPVRHGSTAGQGQTAIAENQGFVDYDNGVTFFQVKTSQMLCRSFEKSTRNCGSLL